MLRVRTILTGWIGAPGLNTFYWDQNAAQIQETAQEAFDRVHAFWVEIAPLFPDEFLALTEQTVDSIDSATGDLLESLAVTGTNGQYGTNTSSDYLPAQTNYHFVMRTGVVVGTRKLRGGSFIGPMASSTNGSDGQMTQAAYDLIGTAQNNLMADLTSGGLLCVWHRPTVAGGGTDGVHHPVFDVQGSRTWAHLTSRRR